MLWHRTAGHAGGPTRFSDRPLRVWPAAVFVLVAGGAGAAACSATHLLFPSAAPLLCGVAAVAAMFGVAFFEVHRRHWVDPVSLIKTAYVLGVVILGGFFAGRAWLGLEPLPTGPDGGGGGPVAVLAIVFGLPLLLIIPIALAIGDRPPPVDESRLDEAPRL